MRVVIAGTGCSEQGVSEELKKALTEAQVVVGFERTVKQVSGFVASPAIVVFDLKDIERELNCSGCESAVVLVSGDSGFFSAAAALCGLLAGHEVRLLPAVSSVQALAAAIKRPWQSWRFFSAHGRRVNVCQAVSQNEETVFLCDGKNTPQALCQRLCEGGFSKAFAAVGENLGDKSERVLTGSAKGLAEKEFSALSVLYVNNPNPARRVKIGLSDEGFMRGGLPMTKSEVRAVILSKLRLNRNDILWDVGAGTGSVTVEAALLLSEGTVYAVERESSGIDIIKKNALNHGAFNVEYILGEAPGVLASLPKPNCVFIGGSGGYLMQIIAAALEKNLDARIVFTAVSLETLCEANNAIKSGLIKRAEVVSLAVSRARTMGEHSLFSAQNPVYIISGGGEDED